MKANSKTIISLAPGQVVRFFGALPAEAVPLVV
jgi:hypothetical protein